jgi:hypothetical protein
MSITLLQPKDKPTPHEVVFHPNLLACGRFGKFEVEKAAGRLVSYLRWRNEGWKPFTLSELTRFYVAKQWEDDILYGLLGSWSDEHAVYPDPGYILNQGFSLALTQDFLERLKR